MPDYRTENYELNKLGNFLEVKFATTSIANFFVNINTINIVVENSFTPQNEIYSIQMNDKSINLNNKRIILDFQNCTNITATDIFDFFTQLGDLLNIEKLTEDLLTNIGTTTSLIQTNTLNTVTELQTLNTTNTDIGTTTSLIQTNTLNTVTELQTLNASFTSSGKPLYDGIGFKTGTGITVDNINYFAIPVIGTKNEVFTTRSSSVPLLQAGEFIYIPSTATQVQVSSTSANDTAAGSGSRAVAVRGLLADYTLVDEIIPTNGLLATTATTNSFIAILAWFSVDSGTKTPISGNNLGDMYVSPAGDAILGTGIPSDRTRIMGTMKQYSGAGFSGYTVVPPGSDLYFSELSITSVIDGNQTSNVILEFYTRTVISGVPGPWSVFGRISVSTNQPSINLHQGAFPSIVPNPAGRTDVMFVVYRQGGTSNISYDCYMTGIQTTVLPPP